MAGQRVASLQRRHIKIARHDILRVVVASRLMLRTFLVVMIQGNNVVGFGNFLGQFRQMHKIEWLIQFSNT